MKKRILIFSLFIATVGFTQSTEVSNLKQNMESIQALQELLSTEYTSVAETKTVVPGASFTFSNTTVFNAFGDASAQQMAQQIEQEFGAAFNGSTWSFDRLDLQNGMQKLTVKTASGGSETANYSCSGAQFKSGNLIAGMDFQAYLFRQNSAPKHYILLFTVTNGITVAADFVQN